TQILIRILLLHLLVVSLVATALSGTGFQLSGAYVWGAALSNGQMSLPPLIGYRAIHKIGIAFTLLLSVFKYGILLGIFLVSFAGIVKISTSFAIGFVTIVPSLAGLILLKPKEI